VANASMKMNVIGVPGYMGIAQWMGMIPGMTPFATELMNSKMKGLGVTARWVDCCPERSQAVAGTSRHNPTGQVLHPRAWPHKPGALVISGFLCGPIPDNYLSIDDSLSGVTVG